MFDPDFSRPSTFVPFRLVTFWRPCGQACGLCCKMERGLELVLTWGPGTWVRNSGLAKQEENSRILKSLFLSTHLHLRWYFSPGEGRPLPGLTWSRLRALVLHLSVNFQEPDLQDAPHTSERRNSTLQGQRKHSPFFSPWVCSCGFPDSGSVWWCFAS